MDDKMQAKVCKHLKSGKLYAKLAVAIDCTNATNGRHMAVYAPMAGDPALYVRDVGEFAEKFSAMDQLASSITLSGQGLNFKYPLFDLLPGLLARVEAIHGPMIPALVEETIVEAMKDDSLPGSVIYQLQALCGFVERMRDVGLFLPMVVKIQRPLSSNVENPGYLVYNEDRSLMEEMSGDAFSEYFEEGDLKIYAYARLWADGTFQVVCRVEAQPW